MDTEYTEQFYTTITDGSERSAQIMAGFLYNYALDSPQSIVDIGCGKGVWGKVFQDNFGCEVLGVDGEYVANPVIPFMPHNLQEPLVLPKRYDAALCLEVAEHVPEEYADVLVQSLVDASDQVIFSAAIPFQTGAGHVNCQWPSYWAAKFDALGYECEDFVRSAFWDDDRVEPWYRQNMLVFYKRLLDQEPFTPKMLNVVHPAIHYWGRV